MGNYLTFDASMPSGQDQKEIMTKELAVGGNCLAFDAWA